ncbi:MAG: hypothetical protein KDA29_07070 [Phycisphaerales bacterium]|nr:hypothetical protein [Phycisphaerales bacterium]
MTHSLCVVLMAIGYGSAVTLIAFSWADTAVNYFHYGPVAAALLLGVTTTVYYLRWLDSWSKIHSDAEILNQRLETDVLRAAWLAEFLLEWDKEKTGQVPDNVTEAFSRGLFEFSESESVAHPYEDLASAFKRLKRFSIRPGEINIER